jgi:hypothetical protein
LNSDARSRPTLAVGALILLLVAGGCGPSSSPQPAQNPAPEPAPAPPVPALFRDATEESGLDFVHLNGMTGELYFVETVGAGAALFDYDLDGDLDAYFVQGRILNPDKTIADTLVPEGAKPPWTDRLFRNDTAVGADGRPRVRFTDVTAESGLDASEFGIAVAVGDVDSDGDPDLYLAGFGPNQLWLNQGDGTFIDGTASSGAGEERWSCAAAFIDHDLDGDLDLLIGNYVDYRLETHRTCYGDTSEPDYCGPLSYKPVPERLLENQGDGRFVDVSAASGVGEEAGNTLGFAVADYDDDGRPDVYVANDGVANRLLMNAGDGRFENRALLAGVAFNLDGAPEASMGVDAGDCDGDGDEDVFVTHLVAETNTLYVNNGRGLFRDRSSKSELAAPSLQHTGFGTSWIDLENDGDLDLFVVNGAVKTIRALADAGDPYPLSETNQIFRNDGDCRFSEVTAEGGPALSLAEVSRGAAFGDVDGDGDTDVLVANSNGRARLLLNERGQDASWIGLRARRADGTDATGAKVLIEAGGRTLLRRIRRDGSYGSSNDPRAHAGLGAHQGPVTATVHWPGGAVESFEDLAAREYHELREGQGTVTP